MMDVIRSFEIPKTNEVKKNEKRGFWEIKSKENMSISDARTFFDKLFREMRDKEKDYYTSYEDRIKYTPREDSELGIWEGERGESRFILSEETAAGAAAKQKLSEYGMDGVEYKFAEPDFSDCCEAEVKIDNMTARRENYEDKNGEYQQGNFFQADAKCAEQWNNTKRDGMDDWTAADVREWRRDNQCSWHECCDTSTMQLVPRDIHSVFRHSGGVAECAARDNSNIGGVFDE